MNVDDPILSWPFDRATALTPPVEHAALRREGCPMAKVSLWSGEDAWLATSHADVQAVLGDPGFSSDPHKPGVLPSPSEAALTFWKVKGTFDKTDPPEHDHERRMVQTEFLVKRVRSYRPFLERVTDDLLDAIEAAEQPVDLVTMLGDVVPALITCEMMGLPPADAGFLRASLATFMSQASTPEQSAAAMTALIDYFDAVVADRERTERDDLASRLVHAQLVPGHLSREGTRRMLLDLLIGGLDTTSSMIALGTVLLLENPDQAALLDADPALWPGAVEELLRYLTIAQFIGSRSATADIDVNGTPIAAGDGVFASLLAANWDPKVFPDPEVLDVTRAPGKHVAFGYGVHQCLGQALARLELDVVLSKLFARFPSMRLVTPPDDLRFNRTTIHTALEVLVDVHGSHR
ncbi:cytochrome P450 [Nocardioides marmoriginsengisoli]|uniref:Cytochrome P450 n=1 Tax=Nocardioides marmoriginsengisoli TaxID=661483 RepID=A0A3N0CPH8_9ACTN|nr:cytochrome P450 [Nocardioides marmoriginsengisoli]RNL65368.1 cytochrome P450 [Nocardioides marmoriginsengisoli]